MTIPDVARVAWSMRFYRGDVRVLTALVEDAELLANLKLLAGEMRFRFEIQEVKEPQKS